MKSRIIHITLTLLLMLFTLSSCTGSSGYTPDFILDSSGEYSGFDERIDIETPESAGRQGYVVTMDQQITENPKVWKRFLADSEKGRDASVRLVHFTEHSAAYVSDLFYHDDKYYIFDNSSSDTYAQGFDYLLVLEGEFGKPAFDQTFYVLTDNNSISFDTYVTSLFSSYYDGSGHNRLVMWTKDSE